MSKEVALGGIRRAHIRALTAIIGVAAFLAPLGNAAHRDAAFPTLYVEYTLGCTFSITDDTGKPISSIAPGSYQVEVQTPMMFRLINIPDRAPNDFTGCKGWVQFQLTGPGVNLSTTLDIGCESEFLLPATYFKAGSTFVAQDLNQPSVAHASITTLASGTPNAPTNPSGTGNGPGTASTDIVGGGLPTAVQGLVTGTLSAAGKATLMSKGKKLTTIKAGRYRFSIADQNPHSGFMLHPASATATKHLTGTAFVGKHSTIVTLTAGRWTYVSAGKSASFVVTR
jgi:hypothetical protein